MSGGLTGGVTTKLPPVTRPSCGEYRGWQAHQKAGEESCERCAGARNKYMRTYRRRTGQTLATLYTPAQIEELQREAVHAALLTLHRATLTRQGSRLKRGRRVLS